MLVIISDLHLTDGTSGATIRAGAFRSFRERIRDMAYDASWRATADGDLLYKPVQSLDVILLGDVLDVIRSTRWPAVAPSDESYIRPWHVDTPAKRRLFEEKITAIQAAILLNNRESLDVLKSLGETITLPPATDEGSVARVSRNPSDSKRLQVDVRLHYMVGNHDWFYHLEGEAFDRLRGEIVDALGLANPPGRPFPHDPVESPALNQVMEEHQVLARHGDIYDPFNFEEIRDASSLGDAIVVDLLNRFPMMVDAELGEDLPLSTRAGLREIDNVRPLLSIPIWIDGLLERTCRDPRQKRAVKRIWNRLADQFLDLDFVRARDKWRPFDLVDKLQASLKFSTMVSLSAASRLAGRVVELPSASTFAENALRERAFRDRRARFIVYGHTHRHEIVPLDVSGDGEDHFDQIYVNSGTWRRVHELAIGQPSEEEFLDWNVMTYLAFFKDDERQGRRFETWSGALGVPR